MSCGTLVPARSLLFSTTRLLLSLAALSNALRLTFRNTKCRPTTPKSMLFGLGSSNFARRYFRNRFFFLLLRVLRCFSSPGSLSITYVFSYERLVFNQSGFPIRISRDLCLLAAPPCFSQLATSFFGAWCHWHPPCALVRLITSF